MSTEIRRIMSQQDRDEGSRILATSFMKLNRLWHNVLPNYEDACQVYYIKLALSMGQGMAYGFYLDGKLIGVKTNFPLEYYLSIPKKPSKIKIFNLLNTYSTEIEKSIPYHEAGEAAFGTLLAMAPVERIFNGASAGSHENYATIRIQSLVWMGIQSSLPIHVPEVGR